MPQDSLRSSVYRSFVSCDDPKGVVECNKSIRKSKTDHSQKIQHYSNTSTSYSEERKDKVLKESTQELQNMSSSQIMEVSRGAQKLNHVIDSWSNDKHSKYIAKDLLKGALDLQESLVMLGKLQEASSHYLANKSKNKQPVKWKLDVGVGFMNFEKPRISKDGSSRDCYDELREVISESFARQNLLPKVYDKEEKALLDRKSLDICMDVPSCSSCQSSLFFSHSSDCSPSKVVQHEKPKASNLIAKLMGLEPSKAVSYKQMDKEKLSNETRVLLDTDLPSSMKPRFVVQKVARERRTLQEIMETMQFKGLLEDHNSDVSFSRRSYDVEDSPIVIMRPLHVQEPIRSRQIMPRKMREEIPREDSRGRLEKMPTRRILKQKLNKKDGEGGRESTPRLVKKIVKIQDIPSSTKLNHPNHPSPKVQKKEIIIKKIDRVPKEVPDTRKKAETKANKPRDVGRGSSLKLSESSRGSNVSKREVSGGKNPTPHKKITSTSLKSGVPNKNLKKHKPGSTISAALVENKPSDDNFPIELASNIPAGSLMKSTTSEQITEEVMNSSYNPISDNSENTTSSCSDSYKYVEDDRCISNHNSDEMNGCKAITNTRYLLLTNSSFLSFVEELFDTSTYDPTAFSTCDIIDDNLIVECAKEILKRKSLSCTRTIFPSPQHLLKKTKYHFSFEQLVGEISDGIEALRSYSKSCGNIICADTIFTMLERDLWWKGEVTGAWDLGWKNGFNMEEVNVVVNDVAKLVLSEIVDDLVTEFVF